MIEGSSMGLFDVFKKKDESKTDSAPAEKPEKKEEPAEEQPQGKYNEACSSCGKVGTDKKWMGQYWHKKCLRQMKKSAKGMV